MPDGFAITTASKANPMAGRHLFAPHPAMATPSLRRNIAWTFAGNVIFAACQWLMIVVLAKLGSPTVVGEFALAVAVTAPIIMLASMQLRWVQATDSRREIDIRDCLTFRVVGIVMALMATMAVCLVSGYRPETVKIICAVAAAKGIEAICDVLYGWYQQYEHMEFISHSLMLRGPLSVVAIAGGFVLTGSLFGGCVALAGAWAAILLLFDLPRALRFAREQLDTPLGFRWDARRLRTIFVRALPVGLTAGIVALQINIPRYFVERNFGPAALGIFAAMAYVLMSAETFIRAVNQSAMPRLSRYLQQQNLGGFRAIVWKLTGLGLACGVTAVAFALLGGRWFLMHAYGEEYAEQPGILVIMIVGVAISFLLRPTEVALRSMRSFWLLLTIHATGLPVFVVLNHLWVPAYGLWGAAWAMLAQACWHGAATLFVYRLICRQRLATQSTPNCSAEALA